MLTPLTRRLSRRLAVLTSLVVAGTMAAPALPSVAEQAEQAVPAGANTGSAAKAPTTGRYVTTTTKGIVLVDEDGSRRHTLIKTSRRDNATLRHVSSQTGTVLYSTDRRRGDGSVRGTIWHVATLYGVELGTFRVPAGSTPVVDSGGYTAYWIEPWKHGLALRKRQVNDPGARPTVVRTLGPGTNGTLAISPDNAFVAAVLSDQLTSTSQLVLATTDGTSVETLPMPPGETLVNFTPVWSPDSARIAFETFGPTGSGTYTLHTTAVDDHTPVRVGTGPGALFDWSPDGRTILGGLWDAQRLGSVDVATGQTRWSSIPKGEGPVFWSGLPAGEVPRDRKRPSLRILQPDCGDRKPAACTRYRHSVAAWRTTEGRAKDRGGSQLRYVAVAAMQLRANGWWALIAAPDAQHGVWRRFPNRGEAKWHAKERTARITDGRWEIALPGLTAGRLVVVAMAVDGARNETERLVAQPLR